MTPESKEVKDTLKSRTKLFCSNLKKKRAITVFNSKIFQINVQYINSKSVNLKEKLLTIVKNERKDKNTKTSISLFCKN